MRQGLWLATGLGVIAVAALWGCRGERVPASVTEQPPGRAAEEGKGMQTATTTTFRLSSMSIQDGEPLRERYVAEGANVSPQLAWEGVPEEAVELAVIVEDPDAPGGDFVHWLVYNIPVSLKGLDEGLPTERQPDAGVPLLQGRNDFGKIGYRGPAPPRGKQHHYHYRVLALDKPLDLPANADKGDFRKAIRGHVIAEAELVATYER